MTLPSRQWTAKLIIAWVSDIQGWTDETANLISANGTFSFTSPTAFLTAGGGVVDTATIVLANPANYYNNYLTDGQPFQKHVRLSINFGSGDQRIFSGAIQSMSITPANAANAGQLTLQCVTQEGPYLQRKYDITAYDFRDLAGRVTTEVDWFNHILSKMYSPLATKFDPGMIVIPWLWADDESVLEEMWTAAAAAGGVLYTRIDGWLIYRNASSIAKDIANPKETLSRANNSFSSITLDYSQDDLYSDVTVEVSTRTIGAEDEIWSPGDYEDLVIPPNGVTKVTATYDDPIYQVTRFEWEATDAGGWPSSNVSVSKEDFAQKSVLTITNNDPTTTAYIRYFRIFGFPITGGPAFERSAHSTNAFWVGRDRRMRSVRENAYIQTPVQAQFLADMILEESELPRALITVNGILGDPTRFPGDVVKIQDPKMYNKDIIGQIESLSWNLGTTYEHSIVVRDFGTIYNCAPYFTLNDVTKGVLASTYKVFY